MYYYTYLPTDLLVKMPYCLRFDFDHFFTVFLAPTPTYLLLMLKALDIIDRTAQDFYLYCYAMLCSDDFINYNFFVSLRMNLLSVQH